MQKTRSMLALMFLFPVALYGQDIVNKVAIAPEIQGAELVNGLQARISVDLDKVSLTQALNAIARQADAKITIAADVKSVSKSVTLRVQDITAAEAFRRVLAGTPVQMVSNGTGQLIFTVAQNQKGVTQGIIVGKVVDAKSGKGVLGVSISVLAKSVMSDENGIYRLTGIPAGNHTVTVRLVGYAKQIRQVVVGEGAIATVDFKLEPSANVLDQVVVTGTIIASELKSVPNAITVITAKQIEERGITRIEQLFRGDVPGMFAMNLGTNTSIEEAVVYSRGASAIQAGLNPKATTPIKTYVDGVELSKPEYVNQIDPKSIERIEILTGPQASTIYGSNAINGVMQIFTKRGISKRPQVTMSLLSGLVQNNFRSTYTPQHDYSGQIGATEERMGYTVGGSWNYTGPWAPSAKTDKEGVFGSGNMQLRFLRIDGMMRLGRTHNISGGDIQQAGVARAEDGTAAPVSASGVSPLTTTTLTGRTLGVTLGYTPTIWWSHEVVMGKDNSEVERIVVNTVYRSISDSARAFNSLLNGTTSQRYTMTLQGMMPASMYGTLIVGADRMRAASIILSSPTTATVVKNLASPSITNSKPSKTAGGFIQGQIGISGALFVTYGLRAEWNRNYGEKEQPNLAPKYGLSFVHDFGEFTTKIRASYGRSTRPPSEIQRLAVPLALNNPDQVAIYGPVDVGLANPLLGPESQQGGEGGIEMYFGGRASLVVTRFNQTVDNLIQAATVDSVRSLTVDPLGICPFVTNFCDANGYYILRQSRYLNIGSIRNQGWEFQGNANIGRFSSRVTYSWTKSRVIGITPKYRSLFTGTQFQPGYTFKFLPEHTWMMGVSYVTAATTFSLNVNGTGLLYRENDALVMATSGVGTRIPIQRPVMTLSQIYRPRSSGYAMMDFNAAHRVSSKTEVLVQIQNLSDFYRNDYAQGNAVMGRQSKVGLRLKL